MINDLNSSEFQPETDAEKQIQKLLEEGNVRPEFVKATLRRIRKTREAAEAVMKSKNSFLEAEKRISFEETAKMLEGEIDLRAALEDAVKSHERWGLLDKLIKAGAIRDAAEYKGLLELATARKGDLTRWVNSSKSNRVHPIFDPGTLTPDKLFEALFTDWGGPENQKSVSDLSRFRRIDPYDIPHLRELTGESDESEEEYLEQTFYSEAFRDAYHDAESLRPTTPSISFPTLKSEREMAGCNSPFKKMKDFARGEKVLMEPNADFLFLRAKIEHELLYRTKRGNFDGVTYQEYKALLTKFLKTKEYCDDSQLKHRSEYPNYCNEKGLTLCLSFDPKSLRVYSLNPGDDTNTFIPRPRLS